MNLLAQGVSVVPEIRFDIDDLLDVAVLIFFYLRFVARTRTGFLGMVGRLAAEPEAVLVADPATHEVEVADGTGPLRIVLTNGTVRVEPLDSDRK